MAPGYLMFKKHRTGYLSAYFLYLVFFTAFGFFGYIMQVTAGEILKRDPGMSSTVMTLLRVLDLAAGPLIIIALYFLILFAWRLVGLEVPLWLTAGYFLVNLILVILSGTVLAGWMKLFSLHIVPWGSVTALLTVCIAWLPVLHGLKQVKNASWRIRVKGLAVLYLVILTFYFGLSFFMRYHFYITLGYFSLHFVINLPPLFYLRNYLARSHTVPSPEYGDDDTLVRVFEERGLSGREREVVQLLIRGKSNKDIEGELYISINTVKNHISNIYRKFGVKNRLQLTNSLKNLLSTDRPQG